MQMKIVPHHAHVQVEYIPAHARSAFCHDGWRGADERAAIDRKRFQTCAAALGHGMRLIARMLPGDDRADADRDVIEFESCWCIQNVDRSG